MKSTLLMTIAASALSVALMSGAGAASTHHGHQGASRAAPGWDAATDHPTWGGPAGYRWGPHYAPGYGPACVTDEGGGRLAPCDYGR
jgi:hypothetical protein